MQVEQLISSVNVRKSCGHDSIPPRLVKESASAIAGALSMIMNESIRQCRYPVRWKMGQVTPLFKNNDELSKTNYRPITVLPVINNIFEKLLSVQLEDFFTGILSDFISSYRRNCSCETALIRLTEDWKCCRDNKETVAVVSMDLSKAFDTIPHSLLLAKLKAYGLSDASCNCKLLDNYLTGRTQRIKIGDTYSKWKVKLPPTGRNISSRQRQFLDTHFIANDLQRSLNKTHCAVKTETNANKTNLKRKQYKLKTRDNNGDSHL